MDSTTNRTSSSTSNNSSHRNVSRRGAIKALAATVCGMGLSSLATGAASADPEATPETLAALSDAESRMQAVERQLAEVGAELEATGLRVEETEGKIEETQTQIDKLQDEIDGKKKEIEGKEREIRETEKRIKEKQAEVELKQKRLADRMSSAYKAGSSSLLSVVLNASTMDELLSSVTYLDKIAERDRRQIEEVQALKAALEQERQKLEGQRQELENERQELEDRQEELESRKRDLVGLQSQLLEQRSALQAKQKEVSDLLASVDAEVKELMAKRDAEIQAAREEEARRAREAAEAAAAAAAAEAAAAAAENGYSGVPAPVAGDLRSNLVNYALSLLGVPYIWGGNYPEDGGTDCSGLINYAFRMCGYSVPRTTYTLKPACAEAGHLFYDPSQLQPGDIVFCNGDAHVMMYIGNGQAVHAPYPGTVVQIADFDVYGATGFGFPM